MLVIELRNFYSVGASIIPAPQKNQHLRKYQPFKLQQAFLTTSVEKHIAPFTALGCVLGAQFAPLVARLFKQRSLKVVFGVIAILDGVLFLLQYELWSHH